LRLAAKTLRCSVLTLHDRLERDPTGTKRLIDLALAAAEGEALARAHEHALAEQQRSLKG
jgi:hypothetical protein